MLTTHPQLQASASSLAIAMFCSSVNGDEGNMIVGELTPQPLNTHSANSKRETDFIFSPVSSIKNTTQYFVPR